MPNPSVLKFAEAIARAEGFGAPNSIPTLSNNPGDLTYGFGYPTHGTANSEGVLKFNYLSDGWQALYIECGLMLSGRSHVYKLTDAISDVAVKYTGVSGAAAWAKNVAAFLGVPVSTTLAQLAEGS